MSDAAEIIAALALADDGAKALQAGFAAARAAHDVAALSIADRAAAEQLLERVTTVLNEVHAWIHEHPQPLTGAP